MNQPPFTTAIAQHIWESKYRLVTEAGIAESTPAATWERVASAAASAEGADRSRWQANFHDLMADLRFLPGGRILAGAGTQRRVTLFNCFVMGLLRDEMTAIFEALKEGALTMQEGGGVGYDFSPLRPRGTAARETANIASGPVSFMRVWDSMCATICSTGSRRGAMMATLRCDHPDIGDFIAAKNDRQSLSHFNCSVQVTDALMDAVARDADWDLTFAGHAHKKLRARDLWRELIQAAYQGSEPGVLFVDQINRENNLCYRETLNTTNPCGEVPLPPYGACNLGSFNLTAFVRDPFSNGARFDQEALKNCVPAAVRFLDNIIDLSKFPLPAQRAEAEMTRRIGLGFMGLGSTLLMLGLPYDGNQARALAVQIMTTIRDTAYLASVELGRERGSFRALDQTRFLQGPFIQRLPGDLQAEVRRHGLRNSHLTAIAPTGTISLLANNVSSGIEPIFEPRYQRTLRTRTGDLATFDVEDHACRLWRERQRGATGDPPALTTARDLVPDAHLAMQAALQPLVDQGISKTINVPEDFPLDRFTSIYADAHRLGLKGVTTFRAQPDRRGVISAGNPGRR
mgnify:CR=1 FL=1